MGILLGMGCFEAIYGLIGLKGLMIEQSRKCNVSVNNKHNVRDL